jgi:phosphate transport system substrate-binding protein
MSKYLKMSILSVLYLFFGAGVSIADNIIIKGSTTVLPIAKLTLEAYMKINPDVKIFLSDGGSSEGITALIDKSTDIAISSRAIKNEEINLAKLKGVKPVETIVAIDAIVPIVHPGNKVRHLNVEQLSQIFQGKIKNWKDIGGDDLQIMVISRDSRSGTFEEWAEIILQDVKLTPNAQLQISDGSVVQSVSNNRSAIGYIGIGYLNRSLRAQSSIKDLTVNGIQASAKTALSKEYPIVRSLYMYTDVQPNAETAKYIEYVLSPAGQHLVDKAGFIPLAGPRKSQRC